MLRASPCQVFLVVSAKLRYPHHSNSPPSFLSFMAGIGQQNKREEAEQINMFFVKSRIF